MLTDKGKQFVIDSLEIMIKENNTLEARRIFLSFIREDCFTDEDILKIDSLLTAKEKELNSGK